MHLALPELAMHSTERAEAAVARPPVVSVLDVELRNLVRQMRSVEQLRLDASHVLDPILDRLAELGDTIAGMPAASYADMSTKALAIAGLIEERSDDLIHRLAGSLARDVLARAAAEDED